MNDDELRFVPLPDGRVGMREKGGRTKAHVIAKADGPTLTQALTAHVEAGSMIHSDEHAGYNGVEAAGFQHESISHAAHEYVRDDVTTNSIESVWAVMKRGLHGVYHHASAKHMDRYVSEFTFRLNDGDVKRHTMQRLDSLVCASFGQRVTYKDLIA